MSASTVSITANPAARRRPVVAGEKKSNNIELLATEAQFNGSGDGGNNDKLVAVSQSKDASHHSIFERTTTSNKDLTRKPNSTLISPPARRTRKAAAVTPNNKLEKPRWLTVLSVFTKNFMLLLVLIALVQMVRRLALDSPPSSSSSGGNVDYSSHFAESEARTAEVESLVKKLVKMIQVQVEVVDKKIDSQVGGLRTEFDRKIHDKGLLLEELRARFDELDKSFGDFKAVDWLSKEDFNKFVDDYLNNNKGKNSQTQDINLDDIRAYARDIVMKEIEKHAADGLGMVDYALASAGAALVKHSKPFSPAKGANWLLRTPRYGVHPDAVKMLKPSFGEPGQCFALKGTAGFVQIRLRNAIIPQAVTLEHVAKSVAFDRSSAPKDCRVSGWLEGHDIGIAVDTEKMFLLSEFTYDLEKSNAQTFPVLSSVASGLVDTIRLDFTSNHGSSHHTCIYRLRVHGYEPDAASMMTTES